MSPAGFANSVVLPYPILGGHMSTLAYGSMTNLRQNAAPGTSTSTSPPGSSPYADVLAALVPSEVLVAHAAIVAATSSPAKGAKDANGAEAVATAINAADMGLLSASLWMLMIASIILFVLARRSGGTWERYDLLRMLIAPAAFFGWTMLQRTSAFDAAFPGVTTSQRSVYAILLALAFGAITAALAIKADKAVPPTPAPSPGPGPSSAAIAR